MKEDKRKVMLIDDNIISLMVTAEVLSTHGYDVCKTATAKGCVAKLEYEQPNLVLVDPSMPQLALDRLLESINGGEAGEFVSVVLFSDKSGAELCSLCVEKNVNGYFSKNLEVTRLPEFISKFFYS